MNNILATVTIFPLAQPKGVEHWSHIVAIHSNSSGNWKAYRGNYHYPPSAEESEEVSRMGRKLSSSEAIQYFPYLKPSYYED